MTTHKPHGPIPPLPPITATAEMLAEARANCAGLALARGDYSLSASFMNGGQDAGWAMRHELKRMEAEHG